MQGLSWKRASKLTNKARSGLVEVVRNRNEPIAWLYGTKDGAEGEYGIGVMGSEESIGVAISLDVPVEVPKLLRTSKLYFRCERRRVRDARCSEISIQGISSTMMQDRGLSYRNGNAGRH